MARSHFSSELHRTDTPLRRMVVVDPDVGNRIDNYRAIFGKFEPFRQCVEQVNWAGLLGEELRISAGCG